VLEHGFGEFQQIAGVVTRSGKAGVPVVSALDDVLRNAWQLDSRLARHGRQVLPESCQIASVEGSAL
jgi:hypothetical protein